MSYELIAKEDWPAFIEAFSTHLEGRHVEIEVLSLGLGDQIEADWLPLRALRFGERAGRLHVLLHGEQPPTNAEPDQGIDHAIEAVELWAEIEGPELTSLVAIDTSGHTQILRFRAPLELPPSIGEAGDGGASAP